MNLRIQRNPLIAVLASAAAMLLLAAGVSAYDKAQEDRIAPGVRVGGIDVGGASAQEARQMIEDDVVAPLSKPVIVRHQGERYALGPRQLDPHADVDGMVDEAISQSREGGLLARLGRYATGSSVDADIEPKVAFSKRAVAAFVARLAGAINREPRDASVRPSGDKLTRIRERPGVELREGQLRKAIVDQLETPGAEEPIAPPLKATNPEITVDELVGEYPTFITIDRTRFKLRFFRNLKLAKTYTIAVGQAGYDTPAGLHEIQSKQVNPTWYVPDDAEWAGDLAGQTVPPGPSNPLKARWMGFYEAAGIHGTDALYSLGTAASHGCIRMAIPDVIELFEKVEVGTPVYIQ